LKYGGLTGVGRELGLRVGEAGRCAPWIGDVDLIVPLPLFRSKQRERGYNQSESIARGIARVVGKPVRPAVIRRTRWTETQTALGYADRQENVKGAFAVPRRKIGFLKGKRVLLVDDVVTTGATTRACAAALKAGGVAAVYVAAIALAEQFP
jgi:ComF family protein